ncbi:uncharacterized protein [Rutidosis leptorrhynchoides]|uniref:uncharacterized protein n=1 Tax=Rutidosis leptorrhynchoides TaxID=125765 RepID=UPI003A991F0B
MAQNEGWIPRYPIRFKVGNGSCIRLWRHTWLGSEPLCNRFNRIFHLDVNPKCVITDRRCNNMWSRQWKRDISGGRIETMASTLFVALQNLELSTQDDTIYWVLNPNSGFSVLDTRKWIDNEILPSLHPSTRWNKILPIKVNIFLWRLALDRLPTHLNLVNYGVEIDDVSFLICNHGLEDVNHVFFSCILAKELWRKIRIWTGLDINVFDSWANWLEWLDLWRTNEDVKILLFSIMASVFLVI